MAKYGLLPVFNQADKRQVNVDRGTKVKKVAVKKIILTSASLILIALLCLFQPTFMQVVEADMSKKAFVTDSATFEIQGTIVHKDMEGGFYAIEGDDGQIYDPINLSEQFKQDGLKLKIKAKMRNDVGGIHMVGDIIEIVNIEND